MSISPGLSDFFFIVLTLYCMVKKVADFGVCFFVICSYFFNIFYFLTCQSHTNKLPRKIENSVPVRQSFFVGSIIKKILKIWWNPDIRASNYKCFSCPLISRSALFIINLYKCVTSSIYCLIH